jgi:hypothetical protein
VSKICARERNDLPSGDVTPMLIVFDGGSNGKMLEITSNDLSQPESPNDGVVRR